MNTEIICAVLSGIATVVCASIACIDQNTKKKNRIDEENRARTVQIRNQESKLQLAMISANMALTVGIAHALQNGDADSYEVKKGLEAVETANAEYTLFMQELAQDYISGR